MRPDKQGKVDPNLANLEDSVFRVLVETAGVGMAIVDNEGRIRYVNNSLCQITGYSAEEVVGQLFERFVHNEDFQRLGNAFLEAVGGRGQDELLEFRLICRDGSNIWVHGNPRTLCIGDRQQGFSAVIYDISDRKQIQASLQESEGKFKSIVEHVSDIFCIRDLRHRLVYISPQIKKVLGYGVEEMLDSWHARLTDNPINGAVEEKTTKAIESGEKQEPYLLEFKHKNGQVRLIEVKESPVISDNGKVIGIIGAWRDITESRRLMDALSESQEEYRVLAENALEAIVIYVDGTLKFVNRRIVEISGYTIEEILSQKLIDLVHQSDQEITAMRFEQFVQGAESQDVIEFRVICKSRDIKWVEVRVSKIVWEGKQALLNFGIDVTDHRRLEEERQRVERLESVGLLAGGIAHDFNNILTAILGNLSLASMEAEPGSEISESLEHAEEAALRARDLTRRLQSFSKGGAPAKKVAALGELIRDIALYDLRGSGVKGQFFIPPNLWHAEVDTGQISLVIHNLVENAQQAMPSGGAIDIRAENITLSESLSLGRGLPLAAGDYVRISVTDRGSGIPPEHKDKVFDPFFTTKPRGSGLGLATSFTIARNHGGHLSVVSEPGSGATFYLYLPASMQRQAAGLGKKEKMKQAGRIRILVMDDEILVREVAERMLRHIGYSYIECVADGVEAVRVYKAAMDAGRPFNMAILEMSISGGMGGRETLAKLHEIDPEIKAIVSSEYADDALIAEYKGYGFRGMVAKPYDAILLGRTLQDALK